MNGSLSNVYILTGKFNLLLTFRDKEVSVLVKPQDLFHIAHPFETEAASYNYYIFHEDKANHAAIYFYDTYFLPLNCQCTPFL